MRLSSAPVFRRIPPPSGAALAGLIGAALIGGLGALPLGTGGGTPAAILAWLALWAPAAGAGIGRLGTGLLPFALAVPASWSLLVARTGVALPTPLWGLVAVAGLFALGHALGRTLAPPSAGALGPAAVRTGGVVLLAALVATGASIGFGVAAAPEGPPPRWATAALDLSPVGLVAECAGIDWSRAQPAVYGRSGVEWVPRRPWRGILAAPTVLVVGCTLSWLAAAFRRTRRPEP